MRWEITVTTHLFVTCRTGFHSAAGEVASRPRAGWPDGAGLGGRAQVPTPRSTGPAPDFPCPSCSRLQTRVSEGLGTGKEGRATLFAPALAHSVGDDIKLAQQAWTQPGAPGAPGEAQSRQAGTGGSGRAQRLGILKARLSNCWFNAEVFTGHGLPAGRHARWTGSLWTGRLGCTCESKARACLPVARAFKLP